MKEKSHWAFAMYGCLDEVIGLLYLCPSLSPSTPCVSCNVKNWGFFWSIIGYDACFTYFRQDVHLIQR